VTFGHYRARYRLVNLGDGVNAARTQTPFQWRSRNPRLRLNANSKFGIRPGVGRKYRNPKLEVRNSKRAPKSEIQTKPGIRELRPLPGQGVQHPGEHPGEHGGEHPGQHPPESPPLNPRESPLLNPPLNPPLNPGENLGESAPENPPEHLGEHPGDRVGEHPGQHLGERTPLKGQNPGMSRRINWLGRKSVTKRVYL
jgi:hypothetical protein